MLVFTNLSTWVECNTKVKFLLRCSEIESQNPQTAVSDESTEVCHSKRQGIRYYICMQNSQCLREFSNRSRLDKKKQPVNERNEMWQRSCVNWIPFIATRNGLPQGSKIARMCLACRVLEVWKNGSISVVGSAICTSCILSLVGQGLQHMQILVSQNRYKRSIVGRGIGCFIAELCKPVYWRGKWEKETERHRTGCEQLKGFTRSKGAGFPTIYL